MSTADEQWVGDAPGNYSLTGLGDINDAFEAMEAGEVARSVVDYGI